MSTRTRSAATPSARRTARIPTSEGSTWYPATSTLAADADRDEAVLGSAAAPGQLAGRCCVNGAAPDQLNIPERRLWARYRPRLRGTIGIPLIVTPLVHNGA